MWRPGSPARRPSRRQTCGHRPPRSPRPSRAATRAWRPSGGSRRRRARASRSGGASRRLARASHQAEAATGRAPPAAAAAVQAAVPTAAEVPLGAGRGCPQTTRKGKTTKVGELQRPRPRRHPRQSRARVARQRPRLSGTRRQVRRSRSRPRPPRRSGLVLGPCQRRTRWQQPPQVLPTCAAWESRPRGRRVPSRSHRHKA
mmetsp:Transcript_42202/g.134007  ORF Transcript_42202/g.134007 Transcript_42202/m.134007 type:complete len:201 (-) Transcript_42202:560-1162(-)